MGITFIAKVKYLVHNIPAPVREAAERTALAAATAFIATAKPLLPQLAATPSLTLAKAGLVAAGAAALAAGYHAAKGAAKGLTAKWKAIPVKTSTAPHDAASTTNG